jgi:hypothetical protein
MPKVPNDDWELGLRLLKERGESDPEKALEGLIQRAFAEGKIHSTNSAALRYVLNELRMVSQPVENLEGTVLAINKGREGMRHLVATPTGIVSVSGLPDETALYQKVTVSKGIRKTNEETGSSWVEVEKGAGTLDGKAAYADVMRLLTPISAVKGANQMAFTTFSVQYVNAQNRDRFDPSKPPITAGQKLETRPVYNPSDRTFGLKLSIVDGSSVQGSLRITGEQQLESLHQPGELTDRFWNWLHNDQTPDNERLKELDYSLRGRSLIGVVQVSDEINGRKITGKGGPRYSLSLFNGGWVMLRDRFDESFGVAPSQPAAGGAPAPAGEAAAPAPTNPTQVPAPEAADIRSVFLKKLDETAHGSLTLKEVNDFKAEAAAKFMLSPEEAEKEVTKVLVGLRTDGTVFISGGKVQRKK